APRARGARIRLPLVPRGGLGAGGIHGDGLGTERHRASSARAGDDISPQRSNRHTGGRTMSGSILDYEDIERELRVFEAEERQRLRLEEEKVEHWHDPNPQAFSRDQRETTTILLSVLTLADDLLLTAALGGLGYTLRALDCPDVEALRF